MRIKTARTAGFCYGVKRAVDIAERTAADGDCWCLGELIHNRFETERLSRLGIRAAASHEDVPAGAVVIIRSHGVGDREYRALEERGCCIVDATCPNVARIHRLVRDAAAS